MRLQGALLILTLSVSCDVVTDDEPVPVDVEDAGSADARMAGHSWACPPEWSPAVRGCDPPPLAECAAGDLRLADGTCHPARACPDGWQRDGDGICAPSIVDCPGGLARLDGTCDALGFAACGDGLFADDPPAGAIFVVPAGDGPEGDGSVDRPTDDLRAALASGRPVVLSRGTHRLDLPTRIDGRLDVRGVCANETVLYANLGLMTQADVSLGALTLRANQALPILQLAEGTALQLTSVRSEGARALSSDGQVEADGWMWVAEGGLGVYVGPGSRLECHRCVIRDVGAAAILVSAGGALALSVFELGPFAEPFVSVLGEEGEPANAGVSADPSTIRLEDGWIHGGAGVGVHSGGADVEATRVMISDWRAIADSFSNGGFIQIEVAGEAPTARLTDVLVRQVGQIGVLSAAGTIEAIGLTVHRVEAAPDSTPYFGAGVVVDDTLADLTDVSIHSAPEQALAVRTSDVPDIMPAEATVRRLRVDGIGGNPRSDGIYVGHAQADLTDVDVHGVGSALEVVGPGAAVAARGWLTTNSGFSDGPLLLVDGSTDVGEPREFPMGDPAALVLEDAQVSRTTGQVALIRDGAFTARRLAVDTVAENPLLGALLVYSDQPVEFEDLSMRDAIGVGLWALTPGVQATRVRISGTLPRVRDLAAAAIFVSEAGDVNLTDAVLEGGSSGIQVANARARLERVLIAETEVGIARAGATDIEQARVWFDSNLIDDACVDAACPNHGIEMTDNPFE